MRQKLASFWVNIKKRPQVKVKHRSLKFYLFFAFKPYNQKSHNVIT